MAMKGYSAFPKLQHYRRFYHQIILCQIKDTHWEVVSYPSTEMPSEYSKALYDWTKNAEDLHFFSLCYIIRYQKKNSSDGVLLMQKNYNIREESIAKVLLIYTNKIDDEYWKNIYLGRICLIIIINFLLVSFSLQRQSLVFHKGLSDSNSPQVSRTLLSILADPNISLV